MPRPRINGQLGPIRQKIKISYDPQHGQQIAIPFRSAGDGLRGLALALESQRVAYDLEPSQSTSTLTAKPTGGQLGIPDKSVDEWQVLPNEQHLSMFNHWKSLALGETARDSIQQALDEGKKPSETGFPGNKQEIFRRLYRGETEFAIGVPVLRHTTNVWAGYTGNVANVNVERIYFTGQVIDECGPSRGWIYPIPNGVIGTMKASEAFFSNYPLPAPWVYGWRKLPPHLATAAGNRISITTEYWFGQHDTFIYDLATF